MRPHALHRNSTAKADLETLVAATLRNPEVANRGLQGVHAEIMRRLASAGSTTFVDYADVRALWQQFRQSPTVATD
jgi:hypothetical protein